MAIFNSYVSHYQRVTTCVTVAALLLHLTLRFLQALGSHIFDLLHRHCGSIFELRLVLECGPIIFLSQNPAAWIF